MVYRKLMGLALAVLLIASFTAQPAAAGVGGCIILNNCGHPQAANANVSTGKARGASDYALDSLKFFLPTQVIAWLRGVSDGGGHAKVQGVGGCFWGCKL